MKPETLKHKLVVVQEAHVTEEMNQRAEIEDGRARDALLMVLGGVRAVSSVVDALSSQSIRALQLMRDEKLYKAEGFKSFDSFLDESPMSPMSYRKFNRLEGALLNEGDELFNYLNAINAPMARRRMLGKGTLAIEGDEIVLRNGEEEQRISVTDRATLLSTLSKLADQSSEQSRVIDRGKKDVEKWKRRADEAGKNGHSEATPYEQALHASIAALVRLSAEAKELPEKLRGPAAKEMLRTLAPIWNEVMDGYQPGNDNDAGERGIDHLVSLLQDDD